MPFETAFHSATRRLASGVRKVCLDHTRSPFSVSPPSIADRKSLFKRRHWMGAALCTLSTAMGRIGLLDYERELLNPPLPAHAPSLTALESIARSVGIQVQPVAVHSPDDFESVFAAMHAGQAEALIIFGSALHFQHVRRIADLALTSRLPAIARERQFAEGGLLMAYGQSQRDISL